MNAKQHVIAVIAGDAGGTRAIEPVVRSLDADPAFKAHSFAYLHALVILRANGCTPEPLSDKTNIEMAMNSLKRCHADFVLTATSSNDFEHEKTYIAAARKLGIPSLSVLDAWSYYRERFSGPSGELEFLPDKIAVMDVKAKNDMIAEGFEANRLVVTGQPAFEKAVRWNAVDHSEKCLALRSSLGIKDDHLMVVYLSEFLHEAYGPDVTAPGHPGFTERTTLPALIACLERLHTENSQPIHLLMRPHPRDSGDWLTSLRSDKLIMQVDRSTDVRTVLKAADLVVGMHTSLLMEACYLKCNCLSLQFNQSNRDAFPPTRQGACPTVFDKNDLDRVLADCLKRRPSVSNTSFLPVEDASRRVVKVIKHFFQAENTLEEKR